MKCNDYAPRTGYLETFLTGNGLTGVEVGVAAGAHAESILTYCDIKKLWLIDTWENVYIEGYCAGRLGKWKNKICMERLTSAAGSRLFGVGTLDFVYLDQEHDENSVREDLKNWWVTIREGGILALRNYSVESVKRVADDFVKGKRYEVEDYTNELIILK